MTSDLNIQVGEWIVKFNFPSEPDALMFISEML